MAVKTPLVMGASGHPEQLQSTDSINVPTSQTDTEALSNASGASMSIGAPVYISAGDAVQLARANASATAKVHGLVYDNSIAAAATGSIATDGIVIATTAQWDAVTGQTGGLTPGVDYFLDAAAAGKLTTTPPSAAGHNRCADCGRPHARYQRSRRDRWLVRGRGRGYHADA